MNSLIKQTLQYLGGAIPPAVFLAVLWALLEPKYPRKTARWALAGFLGLELAVQGVVVAVWDSPELVFTLLPLTLYLPAILGAHLLSRRPPVPTAVSWLLGLLCQHVLLLTQKLLVLPTNWLGGTVWPWVALGLLALAAAGLLTVVLRRFRPAFRAAGELSGSWWPLGALLVTLLALHSYFLSGPTAPVVLVMLLFAALVALWVMVRLMSALAGQRQARELRAQMEALRRDHELLSRKLELGRSYRHDQRHHMLALSALLQEGKADAALDYVHDWQGQLTRIESRSWCKNTAVNAVLSAYVTQAEEAGCEMEVRVSLPEVLPVEELDVSVALANALENAIHACQAQGDTAPRHIKLDLALTDNGRLTLHVENSCDSAVEMGADGLPAGERRPGHGQGLKSIATVAKKYHGMLQCDWTGGVFSLWLVLLSAAEEPRRVRRAPAVCAGVFLALFLLNAMPALAQALESVPLLGDVIRVVDLRSYAWFWGDTGLSVQDPVLDGDQNAVAEVEAKKKEFIAQMEEVFLGQAALKYQGYVSQEVSHEVLRDDEALFILRFDAILYAGNSVEYHRHVVLNKETEQVLELSDLFLPDVNYVFPVSREIRAQMEEQMNADVGDYFLPGGIWPEEDCFKSIDPDTQDFYINEDGQLVIVFAEYEVAPGSMGTPEFVIPADLLDGLLAQPSVLK